MDYTYINTDCRKNKHLTLHDRLFIEANYLNLSCREIADYLGKSTRTIQRELKRGTIKKLIMGKIVYCYSKNAGQHHYETNRTNSHRPIKIAHTVLQFISKHLKNKKYSPEVIVHRLKEKGYTISTSLIYYHEKKNKHLFDFKASDQIYKRRYHSNAIPKKHERLYGKSIELRCPSIDCRDTFGHWEMDTVVGSKGKETEALLVLTERKTRYELIFKLSEKTAKNVEEVIDLLELGLGTRFSDLFKTITVDNGSEFSNAFGIEYSIGGGKRTSLFYCHPYCSYERGSNENNNRFIRRIIAKGRLLSNYNEGDIYQIQKYINTYPRKMFRYQTSEELFIKECGFSF